MSRSRAVAAGAARSRRSRRSRSCPVLRTPAASVTGPSLAHRAQGRGRSVKRLVHSFLQIRRRRADENHGETDHRSPGALRRARARRGGSGPGRGAAGTRVGHDQRLRCGRESGRSPCRRARRRQRRADLRPLHRAVVQREAGNMVAACAACPARPGCPLDPPPSPLSRPVTPSSSTSPPTAAPSRCAPWPRFSGARAPRSSAPRRPAPQAGAASDVGGSQASCTCS